MNALTKLFVSLLIVCSLLLTGGVVVFVNNTDVFQEKVKQAEAQMKHAQDESDNAQRLLSVAQNEARDMAARLESSNASHKSDGDAKDAKIAEQTTKIKALEFQNLALTIQASNLDSSFNGLTKIVAELRDSYQGLLKENDKVKAQFAEMVGSHTDISKQLEATRRENRNLVEQLKQSQSDLDRAVKLIQTAGLSPSAPLLRPADDVQGVVRSVKSLDSVLYATISLGSSSRIEKGMQFAVYNPNTNKLLGTLVIQAVENTESFGRLEGKDAASVAPGNIVIPNPVPVTASSSR